MESGDNLFLEGQKQQESTKLLKCIFPPLENCEAKSLTLCISHGFPRSLFKPSFCIKVKPNLFIGLIAEMITPASESDGIVKVPMIYQGHFEARQPTNSTAIPAL